MKKILLNVLPAIFLWFGGYPLATAQSPDVAQSDQITQDQQIIQGDDTSTGVFEPVIVDAGTTSNVTVQFPVSLANKQVIVQALDGGALLGLNGGFGTVGADGKLSFQFQAANQPGLYRVLVISPDSGDGATAAVVALVQFQAPASTN
jgi:hypothetical protein